MLKEENICNLDFEIGKYCMKAKNSMRHFKTFFDRLLRYSIFCHKTGLMLLPFCDCFRLKLLGVLLIFFLFYLLPPVQRKKVNVLLAIILVWNFLAPLLCYEIAILHHITSYGWQIVKWWNVPPANSNQGRFSISTNQTFAICRKNSHALNSLPLKWIYKCMSEYVKECKVGECKEWFT